MNYIMIFLSFILAKLGEWMSSIDALEWLFLTIAPTEWDSVFLKTLLRSASCFRFNMYSFFMGLHHDLRCILLSLIVSTILVFRSRSDLRLYYSSPLLFWFCFFVLIIAGGILQPVIAWCDAGNAWNPRKRSL